MVQYTIFMSLTNQWCRITSAIAKAITWFCWRFDYRLYFLPLGNLGVIVQVTIVKANAMVTKEHLHKFNEKWAVICTSFYLLSYYLYIHEYFT